MGKNCIADGFGLGAKSVFSWTLRGLERRENALVAIEPLLELEFRAEMDGLLHGSRVARRPWDEC